MQRRRFLTLSLNAALVMLGASLGWAALPPLGSGDVDGKKDPRARQRVSVTADQAPLTDLVAALAQKTGVRIEAAPEIGERRVFARVHNEPLGDLLVALRELYGLALVATPEGSGFAYRLQPDPATEEARAAALQAERDAIQADLAELIRWAQASEAERATLLTPPPDDAKTGYYWYVKPRAEDAWRVLALATLKPEQQQALLDGKPVRIPIAGLPEVAQEQARQQWTQISVSGDRKATGAQVNAGWIVAVRRTERPLNHLRDQLVVYGYVPDASARGMALRTDLAELPYRMPLKDKKARAWALLDDSGAARKALNAKLPKTADAEVAAIHGLDGFLKPIYGAAGVSVIADVAPQQYPAPSATHWSGRRVEDVLDLFARASGRSVIQKDGILAFRSERWATFDMNAAPVARLRDWERERAANGNALSPAIVAQAASLTPLQRADLRQIAPWFAWDGDLLTVYRFYAALSPEQRAALLSPEGLSLARVEPPAQAVLREARTLDNRDLEYLLAHHSGVNLALDLRRRYLWWISDSGRSGSGIPFTLTPDVKPLPLDVKVTVSGASGR